jgi:16S rRNA processing protein RimM
VSRRPDHARSPLTAAAAEAGVRWVPLAVIMGTHGLRGDVRVKQHNPDSELLFDAREVALRIEGGLQVYALSGVRAAGRGLLVHLSGVDTLEQAQKLRGAELCLPRGALPPLEPGEFYFIDLPGLRVFDRERQPIGVVERVAEYPASNVLCVRSDQGMREVPMFEPYLVSVDVAAGEVVVDQLADLELLRDT